MFARKPSNVGNSLLRCRLDGIHELPDMDHVLPRLQTRRRRHRLRPAWPAGPRHHTTSQPSLPGSTTAAIRSDRRRWARATAHAGLHLPRSPGSPGVGRPYSDNRHRYSGSMCDLSMPDRSRERGICRQQAEAGRRPAASACSARLRPPPAESPASTIFLGSKPDASSRQ